MENSDLAEINELVTRFFSLFTNTNGQQPRVQDITEIFIPEGIIINATGNTPLIYNLATFIAPRKELLTNGTLINFCERETSQQTNISGNIAQRYCDYEKSGDLNGVHFETKGTKNIQLIKIAGVWYMASVTWCDKI